MTLLERLLAHLETLDSTRILVCIDGPAGAGKTTLAAELHSALNHVEVIHMDDLYGGWDEPFSEDLAHRLMTQIRDPFLGNKPVSYSRFDWYASAFTSIVEVHSARILIVEGVGSAQRCMRERAHVSVFIDVAPSIGRDRVVTRDGAEVAAHIDAWQRAETAHFDADQTASSVDIYVPHVETE